MSGGDRTVLVVESLDHEGKGVAHCEGKVVFVEGALPGEVVAARVHRRKAAYDTAVTEEVLTASSQRVSPGCPHFGVCGGCSMQHLAPGAQLASKQRVLEDCLRRIGGTFPEVILPAIAGPTWQYRHRARLSVRNVVKKGGVLVGFHERRSSYVAEMKECPVLPERISRL
ncbi:MAG: TRAM domain-containing protein, partial [Burkholderiaceae bacterium]|nr:TRAM domain-containing protein [Burkholderiaceae bacterium]